MAGAHSATSQLHVKCQPRSAAFLKISIEALTNTEPCIALLLTKEAVDLPHLPHGSFTPAVGTHDLLDLFPQLRLPLKIASEMI